MSMVRPMARGMVRPMARAMVWDSTIGPASAPNAFTVGQWTLADNTAGNSLTITILTVPSLNGNTQTGTQYRINGGAWQDTALVGLGDIVIVDAVNLTNDVEADIEIRVLVAEYDWDTDGTGDEDSVSDTKSATPTLVTADVPDAFVLAEWDLDPGDTTLEVTINSLPADNGATITDIEYRVDGGTWTSSGGIVSFSITGRTNGVEYDVELRAVNSVGAGAAGDLKSATPAAAVTTTFDPVTLGTDIVLSEGNLRATNGGSDYIARSTSLRSSGKLYFEAERVSADAGDSLGIGLGASAGSVNTWAGSGPSQASAVDTSNGNVYGGSGGNAGISGSADGDVWGVAADFTLGKWWPSLNGAYGSGQDPVTNTGGFSMTTTTDVAIVVAVYGAGSSVRLRTTPGQFSHSPPTGFSEWG